MNTYIGIDLGTSSVKMLLVNANGRILSCVSRAYPISYPHSGWSEQNPGDWIKAVNEGLDELLSDRDRCDVRGISFGGQMHGLVILDENDEVIRPAILWNDGRTEKETAYLNETVGKDRLSEYTANIAFAGFTAPKILWLKENEPESFKRIAKIMLPKDYLAYKMTSVHSTDYSDASGMLLLDVKNKCWSKEMMEICSVKEEWLPKLYESYQVIGNPLPEYELCNAVVTAGAGDNAAAAVGCGILAHGECNISLGTSGTVFISSDSFSPDKTNALHAFCHANGRYHLMGCILSAASCNKWWLEEVLHTNDYEGEEEGLTALMGKNEVLFLPYLMGERSPHNDTSARGAFIGMRSDTSRDKMNLAVMEGVAFALRDCVERAVEDGVKVTCSGICGGGAKSKTWKKIVASVLGIPIRSFESEEGPSMGAAMLAMVGAGEYSSLSECAAVITKISETVYPSEADVRKYEEKYRIFKALYPALKESFSKIN